MRRMFDDAALSAGYLWSIAGKRRRPVRSPSDRSDLVRHGDSVYCRRCGQNRPEQGGRWRFIRMQNGVTVTQFICAACGAERDQALRALGQRR